MKKIVKVPLVILVVFFMAFNSGCNNTKKVVKDVSDELEAGVWVVENEYGLSGRLSFSEDEFATMEITTTERAVKIHGRFSISTNEIIIIDEEQKDVFIFNYELFGNEIDIVYEGKAIRMKREGSR